MHLIVDYAPPIIYDWPYNAPVSLVPSIGRNKMLERDKDGKEKKNATATTTKSQQPTEKKQVYMARPK